MLLSTVESPLIFILDEFWEPHWGRGVLSVSKPFEETKDPGNEVYFFYPFPLEPYSFLMILIECSLLCTHQILLRDRMHSRSESICGFLIWGRPFSSPAHFKKSYSFPLYAKRCPGDEFGGRRQHVCFVLLAPSSHQKAANALGTRLDKTTLGKKLLIHFIYWESLGTTLRRLLKKTKELKEEVELCRYAVSM